MGSIQADPQSPVHQVRLVLAAQTPSLALADPDLLQISGVPLWGVWPDRICDFRNNPDACLAHDTCGILSVDGADSSAVVRVISSTEYEIRLHASEADVNYDSPCSYPNKGGCCPYGAMLLKWQVSSPDCDHLVITRRGSDNAIEVRYDIECTDGNRSWQVTTGDGSVEYRREAVVWESDQQLGQWRRDRTIELRSSSGAWYTESKRSSWHASVDDPWTTEIVDPDGPSPEVTTREFYAPPSEFAGAVMWQENADGSWVWYEYPVDFSANATVRVNRGWKDDARPTSIASWDTYTETTYEPKVEGVDGEGHPLAAGLTVGLEETYVDSSLVSKFESNIVPDNVEHIRAEWRYWNPSSALVTTVSFYQYTPYGYSVAPFPPFPADRWLWQEMQQPDGVVTTRSFTAESATFNESAWTVQLGGTYGNTIRSPRNFPASNSVESFDGAGRRTFVGSRWDSDGMPDAQYTEWTFFGYDSRGRLARECYSNGTQRITAWEDCCRRRTVTDPDGVRTRYVQDPAGRPILEVREIGAQKREIKQYVYGTETYETRALPAVTLLHGYDEQAFDATVGSFTVLRRMRTISDLAGRVVAEIDLDASGAELLKTTHAYGFTTEDGREVTTTRPDGQTEIRAYYRDGQIKSVTGTGVVPTYYVYSAAQGSLTTTVYTGSNPSPRYVTTTRDMLGRVMTEQRPGWSSTGSETLTTTYFYDSQGDLKKVETRNSAGGLVAAPQLYEYERSGTQLVARSGIEPSEPYDETLDTTGDDRYTEMIESSETTGALTYRVKTTKTVEAGGVERVLAVEKELVRGFGTVNNPDGSGWKVIGCGTTQDERGDEIIETTTLNAVAHARREHSKHSDWTNTAVATWEYGRLASLLSRTAAETSYEYDGIGRQTLASRGGILTGTEYNAIGRVWKVKDAANRTTEYLYYLQGEPGAGQVKQVIDALGKDTYYAYDEYGRIEYTWGGTPQPSWIQYTPYGERWKLHTYRAPDTGWDGSSWPSVGNGDVTEWTYDDATGLLEQKKYADNTAVDYQYTANGQLFQRLWARTVAGQQVTTTYGYDPRTSELLTIAHSDGTPAVTMTYERRGRLDTVTQGGPYGLNYDYDYSQWPTSVSIATSGLYTKTLTQTFDSAKGGQLTQQAIAGEYVADYSYTGATGRLERVTGPGLPGGGATDGAWYGYQAARDSVGSIGYVTAGTERLSSEWSPEPGRGIVAVVTHTWKQGQSTVLSRYDYRNQTVAADDLGRRTDVAYDGLAFTPTLTRDLDYNSRNELTSTVQTGGAGENWSYAYDPIGNRKTYTDGGLTVTYARNQLNQYTRWDRTGGTVARERYEYDADGNLRQSYVAGDMNCSGTVGNDDLNLFVSAVTCSQQPDPQACWAQYQTGCPLENADINGDGVVSFTDINPFVSLISTGNAAAAKTYTWDAENRLTAVQPASGTEQDGQVKVDFAYDHQGRRVRKAVTVWDQTLNGGAGDWSSDPLKGAYVRKFVWQDWLMLAELDENDAPVRQYTWGLDLSGLNGAVNDRKSAGGIGGLLAVHQRVSAGTQPTYVDYVFCHDAQGNVGQVVNLSASSANTALVAKYEYDPYGNVVGPDTNQDGTFDAADNPGPYAAENPMRFSTKYWDDETKLGYWGYRYYSAALGRWFGRDPVQEHSDPNLFAYVRNAPMFAVDPFGLFDAINCMNVNCGEPEPRPCDGKYSYDRDWWCLCVQDCRKKKCRADAEDCVLAVAPSAIGLAGCAVGCLTLVTGGPAYLLCMAACGISDLVAPTLIWNACSFQSRTCSQAAEGAYRNCAN
ncbi:MAG: RHS repeat-associated core domain-containing protein [Phycisphaerae bacterium]|nr:RHS repeat-associated core domain-containing protein [Phycisphaerae bacterium]